MPNDVSKARLDTIRDELRMVQSSIDKYDDIVFKVRSWEVTIWSALMVVFFQSGKELVLLIAVMVPFIFWLLDGMYKSFRESYRERRTLISEYLASETFSKEYTSGKVSFYSPAHPKHRAERIVANCLRPHVFLLHMLLFAVAAAMRLWLV